ncbi:CCA tRNA nucleotidyltransferase [Deinococcus sp. Marseille-Q6407]|uniref:CCA tRNA nucleotidyltransferase n=1 Tax=Deinococcus sp. Marseille-Q6407 TaxID=2969223 RepID=UPI0021BFD5A3|nr:CCA tRNA nucleotidyltransferase [Deinococcus sp. Marseille-Q6407]
MATNRQHQQEKDAAGPQVWAALSPADRAFLQALHADAAGAGELALVGGAVRDALLGVPNASPDLDIVLDTSGGLSVGELARRYSARSSLPHTYHPQFDNATLTLPDGRHADLIRARRERYPVPGQRPEVAAGTLLDDLWRRDFGLNALALRPGDPPALLDPAGGLDDLQARTLRPLHARSLHEDASRLVRAARLAGRLDLRAHPELLRQVPDALALANTTPRLWAELGLLLHEAHPARAARQLADWGAGDLLPGGLLPLWERLENTPGAAADLYAAALLHRAAQPARWAERLGLGHGPERLLARALSAAPFPAGSPERTLRRVLQPERPDYEPLQGRDLLAAGWAAGPALGQALAELRRQREAGAVSSQAEEWATLREWQARPGGSRSS